MSDSIVLPNLEQSPITRVEGLPMAEAPDGRLTFARQKNGRYLPARRSRLRNNLLLGVGFLEIANAGDFAANIWNRDPIQVFAQVLMGLGGTLALSMIYFATRDVVLSWTNIRGLRIERQYLLARRRELGEDQQMVHVLDTLLDVNYRELGTEIVNRFGMDVLMGFGAFVVGIGTFLAIGGDDIKIIQPSNQLTGYIGNSPCALYGVLNLSWSLWLWQRATRHKWAASSVPRDPRIERMLQNRTSSIQFHAALNGISGCVAGAASLATATMWWGYVVLLPCLATSVLVNYFWRHRVGYDRPFVQDLVTMNEESILDALQYVDSCLQRVRLSPSDPLAVLVPNRNSLSGVIEFLAENHLFEEYCMRVIQDTELRSALFPDADGSLVISWRGLAAIGDATVATHLLRVADQFLRDVSPTCFKHQQRYLLETLGSYRCTSGKKEKRRPQAQTHFRNVYTYSGRHGDDWLFGGFRITELVKQAFKT